MHRPKPGTPCTPPLPSLLPFRFVNAPGPLSSPLRRGGAGHPELSAGHPRRDVSCLQALGSDHALQDAQLSRAPCSSRRREGGGRDLFLEKAGECFSVRGDFCSEQKAGTGRG